MTSCNKVWETSTHYPVWELPEENYGGQKRDAKGVEGMGIGGGVLPSRLECLGAS